MQWKALGINEYTGKDIPEHITELREKVESLKCCGNCKDLFNNTDTCDGCLSANHYCDTWVSDNLKREERMIK